MKYWIVQFVFLHDAFCIPLDSQVYDLGFVDEVQACSSTKDLFVALCLILMSSLNPGKDVSVNGQSELACRVSGMLLDNSILFS
jgi:hypothetical protein